MTRNTQTTDTDLRRNRIIRDLKKVEIELEIKTMPTVKSQT